MLLSSRAQREICFCPHRKSRSLAETALSIAEGFEMTDSAYPQLRLIPQRTRYRLRRLGVLPPVTRPSPTTTTNPFVVFDSTYTENSPSGDTQASPTLNIEPSLFERSAGGQSASWLSASNR